MLQRSLGTLARISQADGRGRALPAERRHRGVVLGSAIAALAEYGFEVISCRQERAEIEEAFLALTEETAA